MRHKSPRPTKNGGWLHFLDDTLTGFPPLAVEKKPKVNLGPLAMSYFQAGGRARSSLSKELGVSESALESLLVGEGCTDYGKWFTSWPQIDTEKTVGIVTRFEDGTKKMVPGSSLGCHVLLRGGESVKPPLMICEGATDAAALWDLGFSAIGRPTCSGGLSIVNSLVNEFKVDVLVIGENDHRTINGHGKCHGCQHCWPGKWGAKRTKISLKDVSEKNNLRVGIMMPLLHKDAREWININPDEAKAWILEAYKELLKGDNGNNSGNHTSHKTKQTEE